MADKRDKVISYRRAEWLGDGKFPTLERCLRDAHASLKTLDDRTVTTAQEQCIKSAHFNDAAVSGVLMHITVDTPGEKSSAVPKTKTGVISVEVTTVDAPEDAEFMDGDAFLYVVNDNVCVCSTSLRDGALQSFLYALFKKAKIRADSVNFELWKVASIDKLKLLHSQALKEIEIRASVYKATQIYARRKAHVTGFLGAIATIYKTFVKAPLDVTNDSLRVHLIFKTDERSRQNLTLGEKRIEKMAEDLIANQEDGDDFVIVTRNGQRISPKEIYIRTVIATDKKGKSVDKYKTYKELMKFYADMTAAGIFEA